MSDNHRADRRWASSLVHRLDNDGGPLDDEFGELDEFDAEEDLDALLDAWDETDAQAAGLLQEACSREMAVALPPADVERAAAALRAGVAAGNWPWDYFVHACGGHGRRTGHGGVAGPGRATGTGSRADPGDRGPPRGQVARRLDPRG